jgi:hypothetical protein
MPTAPVRSPGILNARLTEGPNGAREVRVLSSHFGADAEISCERTGRRCGTSPHVPRAHVPAEANEGL